MTPRRRPGYARFAVLVGACLVLAGCAQPPVPRDVFYRLDVPAPTRLATTSAVAGKVEVRPLSADGVLRQRPVAFSPADVQALEQYSYHFWAEAPPDAVQRALAGYLEASGLFDAVVTPEVRVRTGYEIQGRLTRFEQVLEGSGPRFVAGLDLTVIRKKGMALLLHKTYTAEVPATGPGVAEAAEAADRALAELFRRFADDLAGVLGFSRDGLEG